LEILLQLYGVICKNCGEECFNPCFIGNPSATPKHLYNHVSRNRFNPCFIGNPSATK